MAARTCLGHVRNKRLQRHVLQTIWVNTVWALPRSPRLFLAVNAKGLIADLRCGMCLIRIWPILNSQHHSPSINHLLAIIQEVTISNHSLLSMLQPHGSPMAAPWQPHGSPMAAPWQPHGSPMAAPWPPI